MGLTLVPIYEFPIATIQTSPGQVSVKGYIGGTGLRSLHRNVLKQPPLEPQVGTSDPLILA